MATQEQIARINDAILEHLETPGMEKQAESAITEYTRTKIREEGFFRKILPPVQVADTDLTRQLDDPRPVIVVDKQAESLPAMTIPFGTTPRNMYLKAPRYAVMFSRIVTPRNQSDKDMLRTYHMDLRQQVSDQNLRDVQAEEDGQWIRACNAVMIGPDQPVPYNGNAVQWEVIPGGITRESLQDAKKVMRRGPGRLSPSSALVNNITALELEKWHRDEIGGDMSQDILKNGFTEAEFSNMTWYITIKHDLVPEDTMFMFADPKFIGKSFMLEDITMFMKKEAFMIEFFAYETLGSSIGNAGGIARVDFA